MAGSYSSDRNVIFPSFLGAVETKSQLRSFPIQDLRGGDFLLLGGGDEIGDGYGGYYVFSASSLTEDDDRTCLRPDEIDEDSPGRWKLANENQQGPQGDPGPEGPRGPKGYAGDKGQTGDSGSTGAAGGDLIGALKMYAGLGAPAGWLECNGALLNSSDYPELYAVIGMRYGGSGSQFNVPDFRGRTAIGADGSTYLVGAAGGEATHTLTEAEMPAHYHGNGISDDNNKNLEFRGTQPAGRSTGIDNAGSGPIEGLTETKGGGQAHNNMMPYVPVTYIIRAV